jgi:hypothetical protein
MELICRQTAAFYNFVRGVVAAECVDYDPHVFPSL